MIRQRAVLTDAHDLVMRDSVLWAKQLASLKPGNFTVTVEREEITRSLDANKYWFGRVVRFFQQTWSKGREALSLPPYSKWDTHSVLVQSLVGSEPGPMPGSTLHVPTRIMSVQEFAKMTDAARGYAWDTYRARIPSGGEPEDDL